MNILTTEEKLKHFEETVQKQAWNKRTEMIHEYKVSLQKRMEKQKQEKQAQADLLLHAEALGLKQKKNKLLAKQKLALRRQLSKTQADFKDKLFAEVKAKLEAYMDTPAYQELLVQQIQDILRYADGSPVTISIDPADAAKRNSLIAATSTPLTVSQDSFLGGVRAVLPGRHILIDNSFSTKLMEEKASFQFHGGKAHE